MADRPLILLSNDDGHSSTGIRAMQAALKAAGADVVVVAPETEQSASSHALSLHRPLRLRKVEADVFALDGTPADCVYVALHATTRLLARRPDMVVSGINHGMNLGQDAFYSGTVAAAREGAFRGIRCSPLAIDCSDVVNWFGERGSGTESQHGPLNFFLRCAALLWIVLSDNSSFEVGGEASGFESLEPDFLQGISGRVFRNIAATA